MLQYPKQHSGDYFTFCRACRKCAISFFVVSKSLYFRKPRLNFKFFVISGCVALDAGRIHSAVQALWGSHSAMLPWFNDQSWSYHQRYFVILLQHCSESLTIETATLSTDKISTSSSRQMTGITVKNMYERECRNLWAWVMLWKFWKLRV